MKTMTVSNQLIEDWAEGNKFVWLLLLSIVTTGKDEFIKPVFSTLNEIPQLRGDKLENFYTVFCNAQPKHFIAICALMQNEDIIKAIEAEDKEQGKLIILAALAKGLAEMLSTKNEE